MMMMNNLKIMKLKIQINLKMKMIMNKMNNPQRNQLEKYQVEIEVKRERIDHSFNNFNINFMK